MSWVAKASVQAYAKYERNKDAGRLHAEMRTYRMAS